MKKPLLPPRSPVLDRLKHQTVESESGCWEWQGVISHSGYGRIKIGRRSCETHRVGYELLVGPIGPGLMIDHLCRNTSCWRPDHLEPVTPRINTYRAVNQPAVINLLKTECHRGHPLVGENLGERTHRGRPVRVCRTCQRDRSRRSYLNRKAAA